MAEFNNPAMQGYGGQNPLLGTPSPYSGYNPLNSGNPQLDMMFAQYAPQIMGMFGMQNFLPQQFPAQSLMDQMVSAKYMRTMAVTEQQSRDLGTEIMAKRFIGIRGNFDHTPLSAMGAAQFNTMAGALNNRTVMPMLEMMMGAQNVEDVFFGRRGDPTQLQRAVNSVGFYRPDSVSGGRSMSEESLQQFSRQIYDNLYGPDADLNDISGLSAGRVGSVMTDLARRGLLPQSVSQLSGERRGRELTNLGFDAASGRFSDASLDKSVFGDASDIADPAERATREKEITDVRKAIAANAPLEEIEKLAGGADTIRRVDASRVASSLKGYSEAIGAVRQIFGDNGMGNAPMGQLIAALEALTQNSMSAMAPAKIENLMRRTQMASREGGVSLEALMGLSARTGALAQQRGLTPEIAAFTNVTAMEYASSLRDAGGMRPAFGRMDADKAMLFLAEAGLNAEDSNVGRQLGALERIVESGGDIYKNSDAANMLKAIKRGDTSFVNAAGDSINIAQELGRNPLEFMRNMVTNMGASTTTFDALTRDTATQEFKIGLEGALGLARQGEEYKAVIGQQTANRGGLGKAAQDALASGALTPKELARLNQSFASNFGRDVIDLVDNTQTPQERLDTLYQSMRRSFAETTGLKGDDALQAADKKIEAIFGAGPDGQKKARDFLLGEFGAANIDLQQNFGIDMARTQQIYAARFMSAGMARSSANNMRAGINVSGSDGSNFLQRFSDAAAGDYGGKGSFFEAILNTVDSAALEDQLMREFEDKTGASKKVLSAVFDDAATRYSEITVDTKEERDALAASAVGSESGFNAFVAQVTDSFGEGRNSFANKKLLADADLKTRLQSGDNDAKARKLYAQLGLGAETDDKAKIVESLMDNSGAQYAELFRAAGLVNADETTRKSVIDFIGNEQVRLYQTGVRPEQKAGVEAFDRLGRQLDEGNVTGTTLAAAANITDKDTAKKAAEITQNYLKGGGADVFNKELSALGLSDEQFASIDALARLSKGANDSGGMSLLGAQGAAGRRVETARMAAVNKAIEAGTISRDSVLAQAVTKKTANEELTEAEQTALNDLQGNEETFKQRVADAAVKKDGKAKSDVVDSVMRDVGAMGGAAMEGAGGLIGQISSAISGAMADMFKDVKIENVTITNFKLPEGFGAELGSGLVSGLVGAVAGMMGGDGAAAGVATPAARPAAGPSGPIQLSGTVKLEGLDKLIAELQGDTTTEMAPGGMPVTVESVRPNIAGQA
jgi:hypothetical protein